MMNCKWFWIRLLKMGISPVEKVQNPLLIFMWLINIILINKIQSNKKLYLNLNCIVIVLKLRNHVMTIIPINKRLLSYWLTFLSSKFKLTWSKFWTRLTGFCTVWLNNVPSCLLLWISWCYVWKIHDISTNCKKTFQTIIYP